jgi:organic radical activating enzyme
MKPLASPNDNYYLNPSLKYGDKFCAAPFTSLYEGQNNRVSTCCATYAPLGYVDSITSFEDIVNSDVAKSVRKDFLNNKFPKQCDACEKFEKQTNTIASVRKFSNRVVGRKIHKAVKNTLPDGTMTKQVPVWLDLLWTNKCNFACLGCNSSLSSTIALNYTEAYALAHGKNEDMFDKREWQNNNDKKIDYILKHKDTINKIHLNGGEPFMQEGVYELLETLIKHNLHKTISIWAHTNGSISTYKGVDIIESYLKKWKATVSISMSHDGHGKQGEYTRYGLKQSKWIDTYNRLSETNVEINIQTCYSIFNSLTLVELYEWYLSFNNKVLRHNISIDPWFDPLPFTAKFLQVDSKLHAEANKQLDEMSKFRFKGWNIEPLRGFLNSPLTEQELLNGKAQFKSSIKKFDELRNTDFVKTFPELASLYLN